MVNLKKNIIATVLTLVCMNMNWGPKGATSAPISVQVTGEGRATTTGRPSSVPLAGFKVPDKNGDLVKELVRELEGAQKELMAEVEKLGIDAAAAMIDMLLNGGMIEYIIKAFDAQEKITDALKALLQAGCTQLVGKPMTDRLFESNEIIEAIRKLDLTKIRTLLKAALDAAELTNNSLYKIASSEPSAVKSYKSFTNILELIREINRIASQAPTRTDEIVMRNVVSTKIDYSSGFPVYIGDL